MMGAVGSCSSEPSSPTPQAPELQQADASASSPMSDGVVTLEEYQQSFADFVQCAESVGGEVANFGVDPTTGLIDYGVRAELGPEIDAATERCYQDTFAGVERFFQLNDPAAVAANEARQIELLYEIHIPCLEKNNVAYVVPETTDSPEYQDLVNAYSELRANDLCDPIS